MGLLLLTLTISGLASHGWLFTEIQLIGITFKELGFVKFDRVVNTTKNTFLKNPNNLILHYIILFHQIFVDVFNIINCNSNIINTKIIDITIKLYFFFILSANQFFEIFPKHSGFATISESFVLNLIISVPLTNK